MLKISSKKWRRMLGIFTISSNVFVLQKKKKKKKKDEVTFMFIKEQIKIFFKNILAPKPLSLAPRGVAQLGEIPHSSTRSLVRVVAGTVWEEGVLACFVPLLLALLGC